MELMKVELYTVTDAARFLKRSADTVRVLERSGKLKSIRTIGGCVSSRAGRLSGSPPLERRERKAAPTARGRGTVMASLLAEGWSVFPVYEVNW